MPAIKTHSTTETEGATSVKVKPSFKTAGASAALLALLAFGASAQAQTGFTETFGTLAPPTDRTDNDYVDFTYANTGAVVDDHYAIMRPEAVVSSTGSAYWVDLSSDHTGDLNGALMVLNAGTSTGVFYARDFNVQAGRMYRVEGWRYVVNSNLAANNGPLAWKMAISGASGVPTVDSGNLNSVNNNPANRAWESSTFEFTVPQDCAARGRTINAHLDISNQTAQTSGNDLYVDDISVTDIGAAPNTCPLHLPRCPPWTLQAWACWAC
ncbi:hypothetical protein [Ottowia sp. VDI28]|uniref:hypothetical protein n=1 Tax=Ottowia sp. VDI28 TaxID=3133968 RepID=UPI003C2E320F